MSKPHERAKHVPIAFVNHLQSQLPCAIGYYCASQKANSLEACGLSGLQLVLKTSNFQVCVQAYWTRPPEPAMEADLMAAIQFTFGGPMPVVSFIVGDDGEMIKTGMAAGEPSRLN